MKDEATGTISGPDYYRTSYRTTVLALLEEREEMQLKNAQLMRENTRLHAELAELESELAGEP